MGIEFEVPNALEQDGTPAQYNVEEQVEADIPQKEESRDQPEWSARREEYACVVEVLGWRDDGLEDENDEDAENSQACPAQDSPPDKEKAEDPNGAMSIPLNSSMSSPSAGR